MYVQCKCVVDINLYVQVCIYDVSIYRQRRARNYGVNGVVDHELRPLGAGNG